VTSPYTSQNTTVKNLDGWEIKTCRAGGTDEKTLWSNLLVGILSNIVNTRNIPERESCLAPKRFGGGEELSRILRNDFSRIDLYSLESRADSDSFNGPTVIQ
jgi:hypothetical protein